MSDKLIRDNKDYGSVGEPTFVKSFDADSGSWMAVGSKSLSEAGINLFSTLGYDTNLQARKLGVLVLES